MGQSSHKLQADTPITDKREIDTETRFAHSRQTSLEEAALTIDEIMCDSETELVSESPTAIAEVAGVKIGCVLDTGAEASIIPSDVFHSQLQEAAGDVSPLKKLVKIVGVGPTKVPVEGFIRTRVLLNGKEASVGFLIVNRESCGARQKDFPILLGCNALRAFFPPEETQEEFQLVKDCLKFKGVDNAQIREVVTGALEVVLPARTIQHVECAMKSSQGGEAANESSVWFIQDLTKLESSQVHVIEGCATGNGELRLLLINAGENEFILPPHSIVASAVQVEERSEVHLQNREDQLEVDVCNVMIATTESVQDDNDNVGQFEHRGETQPTNDITTQETFTFTDGTEVLLPHGLSLCGMDYHEASRIAKLLADHEAAFSRDEFDLGQCDLIPHEIKVTSDKTIRLPYRRINPNETSEVRELLQDMLERKIIRGSASPYASPVVLVRKRSGALRLCIDYRQLNKVTVKDSFPLPRIDESLEVMDGARYFSSLDLSHGYFQITMHPDSVPLTAFRVPWGLFEFERMPQGLCNSPSTFQRVMEVIFSDMNFTKLILYLDDVLVFSRTFEEHLERLGEVFARLTKHGLKLKGEKCHLFRGEVAHLGHIVSEKGVMVDPSKVERIKSWPTPQNGSELRSFLGLASYYRRFVPDFTRLTAPLHALIGQKSQKKRKRKPEKTMLDPKFVWTDKAEESFQKLKERLSSTPVLTYPKFGKEFVLEVDASLKGLGACLSQADENGHLHPISFASRSLRGAENNYPDFSSFKIELLALKWAVVEKFKGYLIGSKCTVYTDNNPLAHLQTAQLGATEQRWVAQLAPFQLDIRFRPGKLNKCADALSRCPGNDEQEVREMIGALTVTTVLPVEVTVNSDQGPEEAPRAAPEVYPSYSTEELEILQQQDDALSACRQYIRDGWKPEDEMKSENRETKSWMKERMYLKDCGGVLYRRPPDSKHPQRRQLLVPKGLQEKMLQMAHDQWGHQGINRTIAILRERCFWPGMCNDVRAHIKKCFACIAAKTPTPTIRTPRRHLLAFKPLELIAIDFLKLDKGQGGYEDVLVITDAFTKFARAIPCKNQTAAVVARALIDGWIVHYGAPLRIHSDQGRNFESSLVRELCKLYGIEKTHTTPYYPQGNGQTERFNRTLCSMIRSLEPDRRRKWPGLIHQLVFLYNCTPHGTTGLSPYRLLYGREPHTPIDQLIGNSEADWNEDFLTEHSKSLQHAHTVAKQNMEAILRSEKIRHDALPMSSTLSIGTRVLIKKCAFEGRHKLDDKVLRDPFIITAVNDTGDVYKIRPMLGGPTKVVNRRLLIPDPREEMPVHIVQESRSDHTTSQHPSTRSIEENTPSFTFLWDRPMNIPGDQNNLRVDIRDDEYIPDEGNDHDGANVENEENGTDDVLNLSGDIVPDEIDNSQLENPSPEVPRRRSNRVTKGQHRNPLRLPISALQE